MTFRNLTFLKITVKKSPASHFRLKSDFFLLKKWKKSLKESGNKNNGFYDLHLIKFVKNNGKIFFFLILDHQTSKIYQSAKTKNKK